MDEIETTYVEYSQVKSADLAKLVALYNERRLWRFLPHRLDKATLSDTRRDVATQDSTPNSVHFSPDETRMYIVGNSNDRVYQYDVGSPRTLNNISYASKSYSVSAQTTSPCCVRFKPDGTVMYVASAAGVIYQYALTVPWELDGGVTYVTSTAALLTGSLTGTPTWMGFDIVDSGARLFVSFVNVSGTDLIGRFDLNTAWLISSANYQEAITTIATPQDISVMEDGTSMLILQADTVLRRKFGNPYGLSVLGSNLELDISAEMDTARGMYCSDDGCRLYAIAPSGGGTDDAVLLWHIGQFVA